MRVIEHIEKRDCFISFEITPPLRGGKVTALLSLIEDLISLNPPFIDITSHAAQVVYEETPSGIKRKIKRKRPGTLGVCALIQHKFGVDAVPHVLCKGFTREETEDFLIELNYLGIENVLAVRGDDNGYDKPLDGSRTVNRYAVDLVKQIINMNQGIYLEKELLNAYPTSFCIGVAGYPEKHFEAPNMEFDLMRTKEKVDAGADYIVTQMFFDNSKFLAYLDRCKEIGIDVPILPGIKVVTRKAHLTYLPRFFHVSLPAELADAISLAKNDKEVEEIGVEWAAKQVQELFNKGVKGVHFYVMQNADVVKRVIKKVGI